MNPSESIHEYAARKSIETKSTWCVWRWKAPQGLRFVTAEFTPLSELMYDEYEMFASY